MYTVALVADTSNLPSDSELASNLLDHFEAVLDQLAEIEAGDPTLTDSDLSVNLHEGRAELAISVAVDSLEEAVTVGSAAIRAAIHAAGGFTPDWENVNWNFRAPYEDDKGILSPL